MQQGAVPPDPIAQTSSQITPLTGLPRILPVCPPSTSKHGTLPVLTDASTPEDVMQHFETHFGLNEKQKICFRLICEWFIAKHVLKKNDIPPLSMVMTGPGGTGKTYVINAVKALMAHYGCEHQIRYLAPTGSAASLIDGMTIHKGLGIKIKANRNGKSGRQPGESTEDYTVIISVQSRTQLRDEWRFVEVVFIDESSMLSLQLICEMDHAL
ncbi:hypothetical protein CY34DRAFT_102503, partial [Suillus luteus UH-Slu-Lm8-n1]